MDGVYSIPNVNTNEKYMYDLWWEARWLGYVFVTFVYGYTVVLLLFSAIMSVVLYE
jgi:hypothetical protein